jgi:uncharacterized protein
VLAEAIRAGTAPVAIVLSEPDPILALGAIVARDLYGRTIPIVASSAPDVRSVQVVTVRAEAGYIRID